MVLRSYYVEVAEAGLEKYGLTKDTVPKLPTLYHATNAPNGYKSFDTVKTEKTYSLDLTLL
ncbi:MAG: hypothetical protein IJ937_11715, partial [Treponema sp.]|nr:hypothetical protein [Treponema sp.]